MDLTKILISDAERASSETPGPRSQSPVAVKAPPIWSRNYLDDISPSGPPVTTWTTSAPPWLPGGFGVDPATLDYPISSTTSRGMTGATGPGLAIMELDNHRASSAADEKRTKNASASARSRRRRKEREKNLLTTIHLLEEKQEELLNTIRLVEQKRDSYRQQRDFFRDRAGSLGSPMHCHNGLLPSKG